MILSSACCQHLVVASLTVELRCIPHIQEHHWLEQTSSWLTCIGIAQASDPDCSTDLLLGPDSMNLCNPWL